MPASLGLEVDATFDIMGYHSSVLSVGLSMGPSFYCCIFCEVKLYLAVVIASIVVSFQPILCPVVREW